jgi:hypothetical protein
MSFLHQILVGDFEKDGDQVRFEAAPDGLIHPVVRSPISPEIPVKLASDGSIWLEDGYLTCDRESLGPEEIAFLKRLIEETGSQILDRFVLISVDDLVPREQVVHAGEIPTSTISDPSAA